MKRTALVLALALSPLVAAVPAQAAEVVAKVGGGDVTVDEIRAYLETLPEADRAMVSRDPALLSQMVRAYLTRQLVLKEAKEKKFDQRPETKARLEQTRDAALVEFYLQSMSTPPDGFPSEAEIQAAYDANKTAFVTPRQYRLSQIFIAVAKGDKAAEDKAKAKLDEVAKKLKAKGADFAAIARAASDAEAGQGGEIGWLAEDRIVPEIRNVAAGLAKDGVADPIRLDDGWHVVKLLDTRPAGVLSLADVKPALIQRLRQARAEQLRQAWLAELARKNPATINELALSNLARNSR